MPMTQRQRAVSAIRGEPPDRIPFIGRMDLWYNYNHNRGTLPKQYQGWSLWDIQRDLGIGIFGFGAWSVSFYKLAYPGIEVRKTAGVNDLITEYVTPYGTLRSRHLLSPELIDADVTGLLVENPFKDERDYDALQYLFDQSVVVENFDEYAEVVAAIGEDGLALPFSGWLAMHQIMRDFLGYETFYYELNDHPDKVERLHAALLEQQRAIVRLGAQCPAEVVEVGANYDEMLTPAPIFEAYFAPFYREAAEVLHRGGKLLAVHGDGDMRRLLVELGRCNADVVEAITPAPMTSIDVRATRALWDGKVTMWGGIPAILLTDTFSDAEFEAYLVDLFQAVAPGDRFVLGFGDNVPTDAIFSRIIRLADFYEEHANYPILI
jgi:Uroporphyrinogen decarboxylase (URO-D)